MIDLFVGADYFCKFLGRLDVSPSDDLFYLLRNGEFLGAGSMMFIVVELKILY